MVLITCIFFSSCSLARACWLWACLPSLLRLISFSFSRCFSSSSRSRRFCSNRLCTSAIRASELVSGTCSCPWAVATGTTGVSKGTAGRIVEAAKSRAALPDVVAVSTFLAAAAAAAALFSAAKAVGDTENFSASPTLDVDDSPDIEAKLATAGADGGFTFDSSTCKEAVSETGAKSASTGLTLRDWGVSETEKPV